MGLKILNKSPHRLYYEQNSNWHGTTIVLIRKDKDVVVAGDGQVSLGNTVIKSTAKKVRKLIKEML